MKDIYVKDILKETKGNLVIGDKNLVCKKFSRDTRTLEDGDVYIGIKGQTFDGNMLWKSAFEKGASCVIVENIDFSEEDKRNFAKKTIIKVSNTIEALHKIARYKREMYNIPVIGVTGSVGKTSTKDIISSVVSKKYKTLKTQGNKNNDIGLPFTILDLDDHEAAVIEMGMNHFGEISLLTNIAKPTICVITNIGTSHIGNLGSRENILKAKLEILDGVENPIVVINNDNDLLHNWYEQNRDKMKIITYGIHNNSNIMAKNIELGEESSCFECVTQTNKCKIEIPIGGEHFVLNALCAVAIGEILKVEYKDIVNGIEEFKLTKKRMDITELENGVKIINDSYNASLESMKASLKYLGNCKENRKIAVLGDMFELGRFSKVLHEEVGKEVYMNNIDILICSGKDSKYIAQKAEEMGMRKENIYYFEGKEDILKLLKKVVLSGDVILFKASNGMRFFDLLDEFIKVFSTQ